MCSRCGFFDFRGGNGLKVQILSDLHTERWAFTPVPVKSEAGRPDVVVLAGDIGNHASGIHVARDSFPDAEIIYVAGNHEFDWGHWHASLPCFRKAARERGVHFLENSTAQIGDITFLGCTLWTDFDLMGVRKRSAQMRAAEARLSDYRRIRTHGSATSSVMGELLKPIDTRKRHLQSRAWLDAELSERDPRKTVVVTHHCPLLKSCDPRYFDSPVNAGYGSDLTDFMGRSGLWLHGHSHYSCDYLAEGSPGVTRVICNPKGHRLSDGTDENPGFNPSKLISWNGSSWC